MAAQDLGLVLIAMGLMVAAVTMVVATLLWVTTEPDGETGGEITSGADQPTHAWFPLPF